MPHQAFIAPLPPPAHWQDYWDGAFLGLTLSFVTNAIVLDPFFISAFYLISVAYLKRSARKAAARVHDVTTRAMTFAPGRGMRGKSLAGSARARIAVDERHQSMSVESRSSAVHTGTPQVGGVLQERV